MYRVYVDIYSLGETTNTTSEDEFIRNGFLLDVIKKIKETVLNDRTYNRNRILSKIENWLKHYKFSVGQGYKINREEKEIILYDKNVRIGNCGEIKCFWGYDEARVKILTNKPNMLNKFKKLVKRIKERSQYKAIEVQITSKGFLYWIFENVKEGDILSGKELKEYLKKWIDFVKTYDEEAPGFADGYEVDRVPDVCKGTSWKVTGNEDCFIIQIDTTAPIETGYEEVKEIIKFAKISR